MTQQDWANLAFWALAVMLVGSAFAVVALPRIVHSALSLVLVFLAIAGIYILLQTEFIAAVQVIIYVGAVTVLVLFAIMLTNRSYAPDSNPRNSQWVIAAVVAVAVLGMLLLVISSAGFTVAEQVPAGDLTTSIGQALLNAYFLPFEIAAMLLLGAMIGAIVIARE
jgi:NADH:ubiquinone oxidoreductase subunit 6 (subunit J)